jgi:hypothetical protein
MSVKNYEYISDGYSARFLDPKTGHAAPKGEYVTLKDYARLKAEVERLRKAGDWMFNAIILNSDKDIGQAMDAWLAAKEGKPSV